PKVGQGKPALAVAGKPVDLSEWAGKHTSARALRAATDAIMAEVTALVASLRDEEPPAIPFDMARSTPPTRAPRPARHVKHNPPKAVTRNGPGLLMKAAVLGAGSWGTTFAQVLCDAGTPVTLWARRADVASAITGIHENPR